MKTARSITCLGKATNAFDDEKLEYCAFNLWSLHVYDTTRLASEPGRVTVVQNLGIECKCNENTSSLIQIFISVL